MWWALAGGRLGGWAHAPRGRGRGGPLGAQALCLGSSCALASIVTDSTAFSDIQVEAWAAQASWHVLDDERWREARPRKGGAAGRAKGGASTKPT